MPPRARYQAVPHRSDMEDERMKTTSEETMSSVVKVRVAQSSVSASTFFSIVVGVDVWLIASERSEDCVLVHMFICGVNCILRLNGIRIGVQVEHPRAPPYLYSDHHCN